MIEIIVIVVALYALIGFFHAAHVSYLDDDYGYLSPGAVWFAGVFWPVSISIWAWILTKDFFRWLSRIGV